ncbi:DNA polymerase III subunit beta [Chromohalobacter sp. TMW 2.2308]|uniref:Beta sliding clamp n=1 Tax=Chromohalobacter moromii TaxID=2860329 RepID=A0A9X2X2X5_9GAMM|nr:MULTISPECIES: DNA polymerase III subunit beta [Chromohalobacter]CDQ34375.1 DNA polymerase III subunit beta [Virgibacillus halodenitrificans]MCK2043355.1 DNA polymerase III subunit beta [Chromohalobacter moromii]MCK2045983.1 DNA polymerase III subunit beta [Chromohalobacter moromii]MCT8500191.1 DNA polymerase III subunit beta [Chromohalobacter canadensis]MCT8505593.1 DNA polymerase III subunit beta [Chromohalobacter moromii]
MRFTITREDLLRPLSLVAGVVERRQTLPVLSNVLLEVRDTQLALTGTDLEVELIGRTAPHHVDEPGSATVPARKLMDICKSLPERTDITFTLEEGRAVLRAGRSRFTLSTLPVAEFPNIEGSQSDTTLTLTRGTLKHLIDATSFAMAQQDVRYYLNGMLLEFGHHLVRTVATDGHRLAVCARSAEVDVEPSQKLIVPRKGILELARLLDGSDEPVELTIGGTHLRAQTGDFTFTSKLVDGKFPDYERVVPRGGDKVVIAERGELRQVLSRTAILSNEKYRGVRLNLEEHNLRVTANNPEQEEAEENVAIEYEGDTLEVGFNVGYLVDVLGVLDADRVQMTLSDPNSSALLEEPGGGDAMYVVMPMRL